MFQLMDTVLAFAAVMLLLSLLITVVVQAVVSTLGLRGRNLVWAVTKLLQRVSPSFTGEVNERGQEISDGAAKAKAKAKTNANAKAKEVLSDPLLAPNTNGLLSVVDLARKLVRMLLGRVMGRRLEDPVDTQRPPTAITVEDLARLLEHHGVDVGLPTPSGPLAAEGAEAIGKHITGWFDTVMRAAGARFKLWSRWITAAGAFILAFGFQVDSLTILSELSNEQTRTRVIEQIDDINALYQAELVRGEGQETETAEEAHQAIDRVLAGINETQIVDLDFITLPWPLTRESFGQLWQDLAGGAWGKLMTLLLLSLGAPFWYGTIGKLVGFRSALKPKEEKATSGTGSSA